MSCQKWLWRKRRSGTKQNAEPISLPSGPPQLWCAAKYNHHLYFLTCTMVAGTVREWQRCSIVPNRWEPVFNIPILIHERHACVSIKVFSAASSTLLKSGACMMDAVCDTHVCRPPPHHIPSHHLPSPPVITTLSKDVESTVWCMLCQDF